MRSLKDLEKSITFSPIFENYCPTGGPVVALPALIKNRQLCITVLTGYCGMAKISFALVNTYGGRNRLEPGSMLTFLGLAFNRHVSDRDNIDATSVEEVEKKIINILLSKFMFN